MTSPSLAAWLRCPICLGDLTALHDHVLGCAAGHRHDANKRGYISLLPSNNRMTGDDATMLEARDVFLSRGFYEPILAALTTMARPTSIERVVDIGCGTGYYLCGVLASRVDGAPDAEALAVDLSPAAVARTVRRCDEEGPGRAGRNRAGRNRAGSSTVDGLVADVWRPLPIRDRAADTLLNVFAPRNPTEFARILKPGGSLLCVVPTARHLVELRQAGLAIDVPAGKAESVATSLSGSFIPDEARSLDYVMPLGPDDVDALIGMGPSSHHRGENYRTAARSSHYRRGGDVTASVDVLRFRRR